MDIEHGALHVVAGAGPVGRAVAVELAGRGLRVRVVSRRGGGPGLPGIEEVAGDVSDPADARRCCAGSSVVYGCAQPAYHRWPEEFPALQRALLEGAAAAGAVFVAAENTYMYGPHDGPLTEDLPYAAATRKGAVRAAMAEEVLRAHAEGRVRTTAGRASDFYGPHALGSVVGERFFPGIVAGKAVSVMGDPDAPHTYTYVDDFGRALVTLGADERAWGRAWHVPSAPTISTRALAEAAYREAGTSGRVKPMPRWALRAAGLFVPGARESVEMLYEFERPFVVDHAAFASTFGDAATPHEAALATTVAWYREQAAARARAA